LSDATRRRRLALWLGSTTILVSSTAALLWGFADFATETKTSSGPSAPAEAAALASPMAPFSATAWVETREPAPAAEGGEAARGGESPESAAPRMAALPREPVFQETLPPLEAAIARIERPTMMPGIDPGDFRLSDLGPEPNEPAEEPGDAAAQPAEAEADVVERVMEVKRGDTLLDLLMRAGVNRAEAHGAIAAMRTVYNPRELKIGQEITLALTTAPEKPNETLLVAATFAARPDRDITLNRRDDGGFDADQIDRPLTRRLIRAAGEVRSSLFEAGSQAGVPGMIMVELIRGFSYDVDFQRDIQKGDRFEVVFERFVDQDGRFGRDGVVLYGALTLSGKTMRIYRFQADRDEADYYNEKGESIRKALLRTPIDGARITSGFGNRMHPILGYTAMHRGVDFGAPSGTPIQAAGDGAVEIAGWNGAYGNYVRIRHNSEYATAYAHLSRIAERLKPGARVRQGQVIGYVGSTGRSTGPHLHYEVLRRNAQINPAAIQIPTGRKLEGYALAQFRIHKAETELRVAGLEPQTKISDAAR